MITDSDQGCMFDRRDANKLETLNFQQVNLPYHLLIEN